MEARSSQLSDRRAESPGLEFGIELHGRSRARFGLLLILLLITAVVQLAAPEGKGTLFAVTALLGAALLVSLQAARAGLLIRRIVVGGVAVVLIAVAASLLLDVRFAVPRALALVVVVAMPVSVTVGLGRQLTEDRAITMQTMFAALCLYLLFGFAFALGYGILNSIGDPFFADGKPGTTANLLYYSLVTQTTTGFGDFVAATKLGRAASVFQALLGQIYLVTVVALIVGNLGRRRLAGASD